FDFLETPEKEMISTFITLTGRKISSKNISDNEYHEKIKNELEIIKAFGGPEKAAKCWNGATMEAEKAMTEVYNVMLAHIPRPISKHYYSYFDTKEKADEYRNKIGVLAHIAFNEVMKTKYMDRLRELFE